VFGLAELVLDGVGARIGIVGHALFDAKLRSQAPNDFGYFNIAADIGFKDRVAFRVAQNAFSLFSASPMRTISRRRATSSALIFDFDLSSMGPLNTDRWLPQPRPECTQRA